MKNYKNKLLFFDVGCDIINNEIQNEEEARWISTLIYMAMLVVMPKPTQRKNGIPFEEIKEE